MTAATRRAARRAPAHAALLGILLCGAACSAPARSQEAALRPMYKAEPGERVDNVVRGSAGYFVMSRGRSLGRFDEGKQLGLPENVAPPVPLLPAANRRIVVSPSGTSAGQLVLPDAPGETEAVFQVLRDGEVAWSASVPTRSSVHLSDDGGHVVTVVPVGHGPASTNRATLVRETGSQELAAELPGVHGVHMTPSGSRIAVSARDGRVRVYDGSGAEIYAVPSDGAGLLSADGTTLVVLEAGRALVYVDGKYQESIDVGGVARAAAVTSTGSHVCVISAKRVHVYSAGKGVERLDVPLGKNEQLRSVAMTDAPLRLLLGSLDVKTAPSVDDDGAAIALVRVLTPTELKRLPQSFETADWTSRDPQIRVTPTQDAAVVATRDAVQWLTFGD